MGYRNYIGTLPKEVYLKAKDMTERELIDTFNDEDDRETNYFSPRSGLGVKALYECGKYCDERSNPERFFKHKMSHESDTEFMLASRDLFLEIIENYRKNTAEYYAKMYEKNDIEDFRRHVRGMMTEWDGSGPVDLVKPNTLITSWKYEYAMFELARLYKTFDWENDVLVYYGY